MSNLYTQLRRAFPEPRLYTGTVLSITGGVALVELPSGARITGRGSAQVGDQVFVKGGAIEGTAVSLPVVSITV